MARGLGIILILIFVVIFLIGCEKISPPAEPAPVIKFNNTAYKSPTKCNNTFCSNYHECINKKCILKPFNYKAGIVYVYESSQTYNPEWEMEINKPIPKIEMALSNLTNNRLNASLEILGEIQTDIFCWNAAGIGGKMKNIALGNDIYFEMPGSQFDTTGIGLEGWQIIESYCKNCVFKKESYEINCTNTLIYNNLFKTNMLSNLKNQASKELNFKFGDYDEIIFIFGRLGQMPDTEPNFIEWACSGIHSDIAGYSNMVLAENSITEPDSYFIDCTVFRGGAFGGHYLKVGWHTIVHEILHKLGAVDVYETGTTFGIKSEREIAMEIDPDVDKSIMGNDYKDCIEEGGLEKDGDICTNKKLEAVYLDKYNKQKIGLD